MELKNRGKGVCSIYRDSTSPTRSGGSVLLFPLAFLAYTYSLKSCVLFEIINHFLLSASCLSKCSGQQHYDITLSCSFVRES